PGQFLSRVLLGVALYRAGRFEEALGQVKDARPGEPVGVAGCLLRAMAQHQLGRTREAEQTLRAARESLEGLLRLKPGQSQPEWRGPVHQPGQWSPEWRGPVHLMLLRREAEATLKKPPARPKK